MAGNKTIKSTRPEWKRERVTLHDATGLQPGSRDLQHGGTLVDGNHGSGEIPGEKHSSSEPALERRCAWRFPIVIRMAIEAAQNAIYKIAASHQPLGC